MKTLMHKAAALLLALALVLGMTACGEAVRRVEVICEGQGIIQHFDIQTSHTKINEYYCNFERIS